MKYQQGKKTMGSTSTEKIPKDVPAAKEDPVKHQQGKKTLFLFVFSF